jgi:hypothetical protein
MEGARLQVPDVDGDRQLLHLHGKGGNHGAHNRTHPNRHTT